jgi:hypothetical protein
MTDHELIERAISGQLRAADLLKVRDRCIQDPEFNELYASVLAIKEARLDNHLQATEEQYLVSMHQKFDPLKSSKPAKTSTPLLKRIGDWWGIDSWRGWSVVAVQTAALVLLLVPALERQDEELYRGSEARPCAQYSLSPVGDVSAARLIRILYQSGVRVVGGPTDQGVLLIQSLDQDLAELRELLKDVGQLKPLTSCGDGR